MPTIIINKDNVCCLKYVKKIANKYFIYIKKTPKKYVCYIWLGKFCYKVNKFFKNFFWLIID